MDVASFIEGRGWGEGWGGVGVERHSEESICVLDRFHVANKGWRDVVKWDAPLTCLSLIAGMYTPTSKSEPDDYWITISQMEIVVCDCISSDR